MDSGRLLRRPNAPRGVEYASEKEKGRMTVDERSDSVVALMVRQVLIISICGEDIVS
jgi:hypothetical protein